MKAHCPKNPNHKTFVTVAHVMQEWVVDDEGNWIEDVTNLVVTHEPSPDNSWHCNICGEEAEVTE